MYRFVVCISGAPVTVHGHCLCAFRGGSSCRGGHPAWTSLVRPKQPACIGRAGLSNWVTKHPSPLDVDPMATTLTTLVAEDQNHQNPNHHPNHSEICSSTVNCLPQPHWYGVAAPYQLASTLSTSVCWDSPTASGHVPNTCGGDPKTPLSTPRGAGPIVCLQDSKGPKGAVALQLCSHPR